MESINDDQIIVRGKGLYHKSAGGFVFFEEQSSGRLFVALIKLENEKGLFIPKGHLKINEDPRTAALREISEELTLQKPPTFISELGIDHYSFIGSDGVTKNFKEVSLFVFSLDAKEMIEAPKSEMIKESLWVEFNEAYEKLTYDKENLIKARDLFYSSSRHRQGSG
jgi:ADP-ribose pyrophosphatase YjhB (NUDIX family)